MAVATIQVVPVDDPSFNSFKYRGPPMITASIVIAGLFLLGTLIQLAFLIIPSFLKHANNNRRTTYLLLPRLTTALTLCVLSTGYVLVIASTIAEWTVNPFNVSDITVNGWIGLEVATALFQEWPELLVLLTIAILLRDRYRAHSSEAYTLFFGKRRLLAWSITALFGVLGILLFIFPIVYATFWVKLFTALPGDTITLSQYISLLNTYNRLHYAYVGIYASSTITLLILSLLVRNVTSPDRISKLTTTIIIPLLALRAIARLIFLILEVILPNKPSFTFNDLYALQFAAAFVLGGLFLIIMSVVIAFFLKPQWWVAPREHIMLEDSTDTNYARGEGDSVYGDAVDSKL